MDVGKNDPVIPSGFSQIFVDRTQNNVAMRQGWAGKSKSTVSLLARRRRVPQQLGIIQRSGADQRVGVFHWSLSKNRKAGEGATQTCANAPAGRSGVHPA